MLNKSVCRFQERSNKREDKSFNELDWNFLSLGNLFDRERQIRQIEEAFSRRLAPDSKPEFILITGDSGTGKTALASKIRKPAKEKNVFVTSSKFDQMKRLEPYAPVVSAMTEFIKLILNEGQEVVQQAKEAILEVTGGDIRMLTGMIPLLEEIVGKQESRVLKGADAKIHLKAVFCKFVNAATKASRPLVLIMDDLQWADVGSLELIETIVSDRQNHSLIVLGICRYNDLSPDHEFAKVLRRMENEKNTVVTKIPVLALSLDSTKALISSVLQSRQEQCRSIMEVLYKRSEGNVFFLIMLLGASFDYEVLIHDKRTGRWVWNDEAWTSNFQNVKDSVRLIAKRIERLPVECRCLLSTAASLGAELDEFLLLKLTKGSDVAKSLLHCSFKGVIVNDGDSLIHRFFHDRVQQASYSLISESERPSFHLSIGQRLVKSLSKNELDKYVFLVADQIIRGFSHLSNHSENNSIISVLLQAGQKANSLSDFKTALKYLQNGYDLLDLHKDWKDRYKLTLNLHNALAQASCCTSNFTQLDMTVESIVENATSFDDKLQGIMLVIYSLGIRCKVGDAIRLGLDVLEELGEYFPTKRSRVNLIANVLDVKMTLRKKTDSLIMKLPEMADPKKISAMRILNVLLVSTYLGMRNLFPLIVLRMVKLTMKYGMSPLSPVGFVFYGMLQNHARDFYAGYKFGKLALQLSERYDNIECIPRVHTIYYSTIACWKEPLRKLNEPFLKAHRAGLGSTDNEIAFIALSLHSVNAFHSGALLPLQEARLRSIVDDMRLHSFKSIIEYVTIFHEATLVLMNKEDDPVVESGVVMQLDKGSRKLEEIMEFSGSDVNSYITVASYCRMFVSYYLGEFDVALTMARKCGNRDVVSGMISLFLPFYEGMAIIAIIREKCSKSIISKQKLLSHARKNLMIMRKNARLCAPNCKHHLLLLEAEFAALKGRVDVALAKYTKSRHLANQEGYLNVEALALERAGFLLCEHRNDSSIGLNFLKQSTSVYRSWGADAKVEQMEQLIKSFCDLAKKSKCALSQALKKKHRTITSNNSTVTCADPNAKNIRNGSLWKKSTMKRSTQPLTSIASIDSIVL